VANQRIDQLSAETAPAAADVLPVFSIAGSDTKKITVKNLIQQGAALVDDASIPAAKVNFSGISGTSLTNATVTAAKLDTSTIPVTGGITVSSSNLQLVAPTSPIARNAGTGSLEHAVSGVTAGTYTKLTVDTKGHVTVGAAIASGDLPIAISGTVGAMSPGTGLSVTGGGVVNHTNSVTAGTTSGITFDAQGHITGAVALTGANLPVATSGVKGAVRPGTGLTVDVNGILDVSAATNAVLGGVIVGSDFGVTTGTISLATQAGLTAGTYTKATFNSKGIATGASTLAAGDIPNLAATQITTGSLDIARIAANTVTGAKLANYSVCKISDTQPTADYTSQFFFNPLSKDLFLYDGNVYQPIGISVGEIIFAGTFNASTGSGTGLITSVTAEGTAIGLTVGTALPSATAGNSRYYVVVATGGTVTTGNAPHAALNPPDIILSNGTTWVEIDISQTFTTVTANQVSFTPFGSLASANVQAALEELDTEKLTSTGGTITGNLEFSTTGSLSFEGATANTFETTLAVVDPTADRTITLPDTTGTVVTTGDSGTVTSTMLLDGTILNADINASAAIAYSKLATLTSGNIVLGSSANIATSTAVSGDITISNTGVTAIVSDVIVNADINASAAIVDTKLATIATAGKVSNSATTATDANTASAIVSRNASGNFTAGTITAALTGTASGNLVSGGALGTPSSGTLTNCTFPTLNQSTTGNAATVTTNANLTGDVTSVGNATSIAAGVIVDADINASAAIAGSKIVAATTSVVGAVQLSDSTSTTSSVLAATPTAVKAAYDLAAAALPLAGGTVTGNVILDNQVDARFREATANGTNYVGFQSPATIAADVLWTLPAADGTAGQVISTDGTGTLSWATAGGSGDVTLTGTQTLTNKTLTSPILTTPALGTPASGTLTNCTFPTLNQSTTGNAATVTTNANLTGDVTSVGNATAIAANVIVNADINASAGIVDTKLATISTAGKVSNSSTTATNANTASAIVARDASGNFTAGTITAALTGTASGNLVSGGALGTPSSGTLTNCTGLPVSGITVSTSTALGVGSIELGNASDTTLSRSAAGVLAVEGVVIPSISSTSTLTNKTLTDPAIIGTILEDVFTITDGAAFEIDPGNGSIQLITLGASRTPKATNMVAGESVTLMVNDGLAYTLTWSDATFGGSGVVWKTDAGVAPTLNTTGFTVIVLWKVSTQVYGARVGDA
jgi:Phage tail fibre repeat